MAKIYESTAPCRISLFGGGTDVGEYADKYGGMCINMAINFVHSISGPREFLSLEADDSNVFFDTFINQLNLPPIMHVKNGTIESGLGSSAAVAVAMVNLYDKLRGLGMGRDELAELAWKIEVENVGLFGGKQDQYAAAYGGVNGMIFENGKVEVVPLSQAFPQEIQPHLVLVHTGITRKNTKIQNGLRTITPQQKEQLDMLKKIAYNAVGYIAKGDVEAVGKLMDLSWKAKKKSNHGVTGKKIDEIYAKAKKLGAFGGKLLGSGGGGHMLFVVPQDEQVEFLDKLGLVSEDFEINYDGASIRELHSWSV